MLRRELWSSSHCHSGRLNCLSVQPAGGTRRFRSGLSVVLPEPPAWFVFSGILSGELLLLFFVAAFAAPFITMFTFWRARCPSCGSPAKFFFVQDPVFSHSPHWTDLLRFALFTGVNVAWWCRYEGV